MSGCLSTYDMMRLHRPLVQIHSYLWLSQSRTTQSFHIHQAAPDSWPIESWLHSPRACNFGEFSRTHELKHRNVQFQILTTEQTGQLANIRDIPSGSATSTFEPKWLRKSCCSQWEIQKGNPDYQREDGSYQRCQMQRTHKLPDVSWVCLRPLA